jgi:hypothetical protein
MARVKQAIKDLQRTTSRVGWFESAKYEDGTPVAYVATIQEFGYAAGGIPPRPFFRPTITEQQGAWRTLIGQAVKGMIAGNRTAYQTMELLGLQGAGDVRKTISKITAPPLSLLTLMARKARLEYGKAAKKDHNKSLRYGPQRPIAGFKMTGRKLGELSKQMDKGPPDVSGVSQKPLVDTRVLINTLTHVTEVK